MPHFRFLTREHVDDARLDWPMMVKALASGYRQAPAQIGDLFLTREGDTLLNRAAWEDGVWMALKTFSIMAQAAERDLSSVPGAMVVFDQETGTPARCSTVVDHVVEDGGGFRQGAASCMCCLSQRSTGQPDAIV